MGRRRRREGVNGRVRVTFRSPSSSSSSSSGRMPRKAIKKYLNCQMANGGAAWRTPWRTETLSLLLSRPLSLSLLVYSAGGSRKFMHTFVCCFFLTFPLFLLSSLELCDCVREHNGKMASVHATHPPSTHRVGNRRPIGWLAVRIDWLNCHFMKFVSLLRCAWKSWAREKRLQGRGEEERGVLRTEGACSGRGVVAPTRVAAATAAADLCLCAFWLPFAA